MIVALTLATLAVVVVASLAGGTASTANLTGRRPGGILQSAGLLFFAFAGYARIATLGEEVVDPRRTIPQAIPLALGIVLVVYLVVGVCALLAVGPDGLAATAAPLRAVVEAGSFAAWSPVVQVGAAVASLGALLALLLGVSRTALAMARERELPDVPRGRPPPARGAVPRGAGGRGRRDRARGHPRRARRDRVLVVRRAHLLRPDQRVRAAAGTATRGGRRGGSPCWGSSGAWSWR